MERGERLAWMALAATAGLGAKRLRARVLAAGSARAALAGPLPDSARQQARTLRQLGARCWIQGDPGWPASLQLLPDTEPVLFLAGRRRPLAATLQRIAVLGARACTPYGREQAYRFGAGLAAGGAVVVSGGARGIDQHAMWGALKAGGKVVAVVGSGLDCPYPPEAADLYRAIVAEGGTLLSPFPCGTPPRRGNFPRRNALLAQLSDAVLVVEAALRSGTFSTVHHADRASIPLYAMPGPVDSPVSQGPHELIRECAATLVRSPAEILAQLSKHTSAEATPEHAPILEALQSHDLSADELHRRTGLALPKIQYLLSEMQLAGKVRCLAGGLYHPCGPYASARP